MSVAELKDALRDTLDKKGSLREVKAKLRAELYNALHDTDLVPKPAPSTQNLVINELIREYLAYNGYRETLSVFVPETGQPSVRPFDRSFLAEHLHVVDGPNTRQLPLLYTLVAAAEQPQPQNPQPLQPGSTS